MRIKIEKSLLEEMLIRPIIDKVNFKSNKAKLDEALSNQSPDQLQMLSDYFSTISVKYPESNHYYNVYQYFIQQLILDQHHHIPCLPVDFFLTEVKKVEIFEQVFHKLDKIRAKTIQKNFRTFLRQVKKNPHMSHAEIRRTINVTPAYRQLANRLEMKMLKDYAIRFYFPKLVFRALRVVALKSFSRKYNHSKRFLMIMEKVRKSVKKFQIRSIGYKLWSINNYYKVVDQSLSKVFEISFFQLVAKGFGLIKVKANKKTAAADLFAVIREYKYRKCSRALFTHLKSVRKISKQLTRSYDSLRKGFLVKLLRLGKNLKIQHKYFKLYRKEKAKIEVHEWCLQMKIFKQRMILRKFVMANMICESKEKLLRIYKKRANAKTMRRKLKNYLQGLKKRALQKLQTAEKYWKFPNSKKIALHQLTSNSADSTAKAFTAILTLPKNIALQENTNCLRCFSIIDSSISNQKLSLKTIEEDTNKLLSQATISNNFINTIKDEIDKLERFIQLERRTREEKISNKQVLERLNFDYTEAEKVSNFLQRDRKELTENILKRNNELKLLITSTNQKKMLIIDLESQIENMDSEYIAKCEEKRRLQNRETFTGRKVNLSPISANKNSGFYRNGRDSPLNYSNSLAGRSTEFPTVSQEYNQVYSEGPGARPPRRNISEAKTRLFTERTAVHAPSRIPEAIMIVLILVIIGLLIFR